MTLRNMVFALSAIEEPGTSTVPCQHGSFSREKGKVQIHVLYCTVLYA